MKYFSIKLGYLLLFFLCPPVFLFCQDSSNKINHSVQLQMGAAGAKYYSGIAVGFSYEAGIKKYFVKASINYLEEFLLFGGTPQNVTDYSLTINKAFPIKPFVFSAGVGLAYVENELDIENFFTPDPGYFVPDEYRMIKKSSIGYPVDLQIMAQRKKGLKAGFGFHANFNAIQSFYNGYLQIGYSF